jgi:uncharacterized membrane protein
MVKQHIKALKKEQEQYGPIVNVNKVRAKTSSFNDAIAVALTSLYGSMWFVYFLIAFISGWMLWQGFITKSAFDPYPFVFLLFLGNLIQLIGGPVIQVGQNITQKHAELIAEADHVVNKSNYEKIERIIQELVVQTDFIQKNYDLVMQCREILAETTNMDN